MAVNRKVEVLPPLRSQWASKVADVFNESRLRSDLARLIDAPSLFEQYIERARVRFQKAGERAILDRWVEYYQSREKLHAAKTAMRRKKSEYLQLAFEHEVQTQDKLAAIAGHEANREEHNLRRDIAEYKRQHLERFVEGGNPVPEEPKDTGPKLTPEQQRRLKRMEIEDKLRELDNLEAEALKTARSEADRKRVENMYADKREELREQLARNLV